MTSKISPTKTVVYAQLNSYEPKAGQINMLQLMR